MSERAARSNNGAEVDWTSEETYEKGLKMIGKIQEEMLKGAEQSRRFGELWQQYYDESRPWWRPKFLDESLNSASRRFSARCERARARAFMETHSYEEYARAVEGLGGEPPMARYV